MDMSKYRALFISEVDERLSALERELVELERQPHEGARIDEVFRHLHSIKGMSASMGQQEISRLAHRLEDLMACPRDSATAVSRAELDVLLCGLDEMRSRMKAVTENRPVPEVPPELFTRIDEVLKRVRAAEQPQPARSPFALSPPTASSVDGDGSAYDIVVDIADDCQLPAVRAVVVYKRLADCGRLEWVKPTLEELRTGQLMVRQLTACLRTKRSQAEIRQALEAVPELDGIEIKPTAASHKQSVTPTPPPMPTKPLVLATPVAAQPPSATAAERPVGHETVRVRTDLLDNFVDTVGQLLTLRATFEELSERINDPALREGVRRLTVVVRQLQDRVLEVRMVSVTLLTQRLPRICRDLAHSQGKQLRFTIHGEEVELDRALVEALDTPLLHLLRNAIDHGIEPPEERVRLDKPSEGKLELSFSRVQDRVLLKLSDDGRGIDPEQILRRAKELKLVPLERANIDQAEAFELLFRSGFSTSNGVSTVSGRGVGLDVVRNAVTRMGGRVSVASQVGRGTTFTVDLPLTLAVLQVLLVEVGPHLLALPAARVVRAVAIHPGQVTATADREQFNLGGESYAFIDLLNLLGDKPDERPPPAREAIVLGGESLLAVGVNSVTGQREVVLKSIGPLFQRLGPFSGSTVLGDGRPLLILDVDALLRISGRARGERAHGS
jgi:two-component system chemotaxis sensor kinase CheA